MIMDREQVMKFLPHRDPFLFVDSVLEIDVPVSETTSREDAPKKFSSKDLLGGKVVCSFFTRENLSIFEGHFPGNPILPGVVQVEMMGQSASFMITKYIDNPDDLNLQIALMQVNNAKFRKPIRPNMELTIEGICSKARGPIMGFDCKIFHKGELMSEASVIASVQF
jgi:3-hydroxyacyl-[acyl-carrier-protein] dehydratase